MRRHSSYLPASALPLLLAACSAATEAPSLRVVPVSAGEQEAEAAAPERTPGVTTPPASSPAAPAEPPEASGPPSGCGLAAKSGAETRSLVVGDKTRKYLQVVPQGYDPAAKLPLVIGFHTLGDSAAGGRAMFDLEDAAAGKAIFVYPSALPSAAFDGKTRWDLAGGSDDFRFVDALIEEVSATLCVDRARIFTTGFSNGGRMATLVGCHRGDVVRAVAPVAPGGGAAPLPANGCAGDVAVWETLGDADAAHAEPGIAIRDHFIAANGCTPSATKPDGCVAYAGCKEGLGVTFCRHPGGHVWPAFASAAVWKFFAAQQ
jgi:polyhydroxybutyrate depolymerase